MGVPVWATPKKAVLEMTDLFLDLEEGCVHHWLVDAPDLAETIGLEARCSKCGQCRTYKRDPTPEG